MPGAAAARRYARALFNLASEEGRVAEVRDELATIASLLDENPAIQDLLFRPLHPANQRRGALAALSQRLGCSSVVQNFLQFLIDQRRLIDFPTIRAELERLADEAAGRTQAQVVAANPLAEGQLERLRQALARRSGHEVDIRVQVDPELLGGVIAKVGDLVFDGSIRTQLRRLRANLTKEH